VHVARLDQTDAFTYDGDASFKQARARYQYDTYGNVTRTDDDGEVTVTGDERSTVTTYIPHETAWIVNRPKLIQTLDQAQTVVAQLLSNQPSPALGVTSLAKMQQKNVTGQVETVGLLYAVSDAPPTTASSAAP
jgi:hypothetical protein